MNNYLQFKQDMRIAKRKQLARDIIGGTGLFIGIFAVLGFFWFMFVVLLSI